MHAHFVMQPSVSLRHTGGKFRDWLAQSTPTGLKLGCSCHIYGCPCTMVHLSGSVLCCAAHSTVKLWVLSVFCLGCAYTGIWVTLTSDSPGGRHCW